MKSLPLFATLLAGVGAAFAQPAGSLLVLNKAENTLAIVNPATNAVVAKIPTGDGPHEVVTSPDGRLAFVANYGGQKPGNSLSVVDLVARKELRRVDLGPLFRPHGIVERDGKVYFTSEHTRTVARYDFASDRLDWLMGTGASIGHMLVLTPDGDRIFIANILSDNVTVIDLGAPPQPQYIAHIPVGKKPEAIDISPDGREVWVGHNDDGGISIIDAKTRKLTQTFTVGQMPIRVKFTPDGKRVLVSDPKAGEFVIVDAAQREVIKRVPAPGAPVGILVAPDGTRAYVARMQAGVVGVFDLTKLEWAGVFETGLGPDGLAWAAAVKE